MISVIRSGAASESTLKVASFSALQVVPKSARDLTVTVFVSVTAPA